MAMLPACTKGGSGPMERSHHAHNFIVLSYTGPGTSIPPGSAFRVLALDVEILGPNTSFAFLVPFVPCSHPLLIGPKSHFHPQVKKSARCCRFESRNNSEFITTPFIGKTSSLLVNYRSCDQYVTSGVTCLVISYICFRHNLFYTSRRPVLPASRRPVLPSSLPPVLPSSRPPVLPSSRPPVLPSSRPPVLPSSRPPALPPSRPPVLPSSRRHVVPSSPHHLVTLSPHPVVPLSGRCVVPPSGCSLAQCFYRSPLLN